MEELTQLEDKIVTILLKNNIEPLIISALLGMMEEYNCEEKVLDYLMKNPTSTESQVIKVICS